MLFLRLLSRFSLGLVALSTALCLALPGSAAEPLELQNRQPEPGTSREGAQPDRPTAPGQAQPLPGEPQPSAPTIIIPEVTGPQTPAAPTIIVPVVPVPDTPDAPETQLVPETPVPPAVVVPVRPVTPEAEQPRAETVQPEEPKESNLPLTPGHFLPKTEEPPEPKQAETKPAPVKPEPEKQAQAPEPKKSEPREPRPGDPLQIPDEARETGSLDFLEGCWVGTRPEYHTKRIVTERFCFGKDGVGKRLILDPGLAGQCVGATRAVLNQGGVLRMQSERMYCTDIDDTWGASEMTCQGEGEHTPCTWVFHDVGGARQSYSIRFVRE